MGEENERVWKDYAKSKNEKCESCRFWDPIDENHPIVESRHCNAGEAGDCRRYPPVMIQDFRVEVGVGIELYEAPFGWLQPMTNPEAWCGEYKRKEE